LRFVDREESLSRVLMRLGFAQRAFGRLEAASETLKEAIEIATPRGLWGVAAKAYHNLAHVALYAQSSPSLALWNAQQAAQAATRAGDQYDLQGALLTILSIETRRGNADRAQQLERQLGELSFSDAGRSRFIASSQAHRCAWSGQFGEAHRLFGSILDRQPQAADRLAGHAFYALTLALANEKKKSAAAAERAAAELSEAQPAAGAFGSTVEECALLFAALAEVLNGRMVVASRLLKRRARSDQELSTCVRRAVEELVRLSRNPAYAFEDFDDALEAIKGSGWGGYARYLELARDHIERSYAPEAEQAVQLTPSELRILRSLASGLSPKEIASEMNRSPLTVQTHIQNLAQKLGSHGRQDAIATARRLGFLDGSNGPT
jgi:DNA-binding NarL/FixJ family response regulator